MNDIIGAVLSRNLCDPKVIHKVKVGKVLELALLRSQQKSSS